MIYSAPTALVSSSSVTGAPGSEAVVSIELEVFADLEEASQALARRLIEAAAHAVAERGRFCLALTGGRTPESLYRQLASRSRSDIAWERVRFFWSDERYVPPHHDASNVAAARKWLLDRLDVPVPEEHIFAPDTALGTPSETARQYERTLVANGPLDVVLLGLGEDGHIASLFPGSPELGETSRLVSAVENSPKPPRVRITVTLAALAQSKENHVLVSGERKRAALARALKGDPDAPLSRAKALGASLSVWADASAAPHRARA